MTVNPGFELSGWSEYKERTKADLDRIEAAQARLERSIQEVRESIGSKIDTFRTQELEKLRRDIAEQADRIAQNGAQISALQVKAGVWGGLAGGIPAAVAILIEILKK